MYYWNIKALKEELKGDGLTESSALNYFITLSILYSLGVTSLEDSSDYIMWIVLVVSNVLGYHYIFRCNGGATGKRFLEKATSLTFVYSIRFFVMVIIPITILYGLVESSEKLSRLAAQYFTFFSADLLMTIILSIAFFWGFGEQIKETTETTSSPTL